MSKKLQLIVCTTLFAFSIVTASGQIRIGAEAGVNLSKLSTSSSNFSLLPYETSNLLRLRAGVVADIAINNFLSFQPGVFYSMKGSSFTAEGNLFGISYKSISTLKLNYLEIPLILQAKYGMGPGKIFVGVGPSLAMGIDGSDKITGEVMGVKSDTSYAVHFGSDSDKIARFDYSANFQLGYESDLGLFVRIGYNLGFANLSNSETVTLKSRCFTFTAGYLLNRRRR